MKILFSGAWMGVTLLMLSSCATTERPLQEPSLTFLTHNELKTLMSGTRTVSWTSSGLTGTAGLTGTGIYTQDGTALLRWDRGSAEGTWRINGDRFCTTYPKIRRGYETCHSLHKTGENEYKLFLPDGSFSGTWRL